MALKFGVLVPQGWRMDLAEIPDPIEKYETMTRVAREAEALGYDSIWLYDHFHTVPTAELETAFECWTCTAALARDTRTIRLGQMVTCNNYRNPALLAKIASTVDVLSHGRLDFGIGAGWYEEEFRAYGYDFPDGPTRLKMLGEALQIIHAMWTEDSATFEGQYYRVAGAINEPKGVQRPHPPIWIGGGGERVTLKLVAQYGDACNIQVIGAEAHRHKFAVLREHCARLGRDYDRIIKSAHVFMYLLAPGEDLATVEAEARRYWRRDITLDELRRTRAFIGTPAEAVLWLRELLEAGVEYFLVYFYNHLADLGSMRRFAEEVIPPLRAG